MNFMDGSLLPENQQNLVITAAPYGPEWIPADFPEDIPVSMEAQIQKAVDCYNAGATVLHLHVREENGKGSKRLSRFNELLAGIRARVPEMILQVGGSISFSPESEGEAAKWLSDDTRHMLAELEPRPDQVTIAINTEQMNVVEQMCPGGLKDTSFEPGHLSRVSRDDDPRRAGVGGGAHPPPQRRHPDAFPARNITQLETVERMMRRGGATCRSSSPGWPSAAASTLPTSTTWPTSCAPAPTARCSRSRPRC